MHVVPTSFVGTAVLPQGLWVQANWFPIGCSDKFVGKVVPTNIVGTPNGDFLLAVPTDFLEQTSIYNSTDWGPSLNCRTSGTKPVKCAACGKLHECRLPTFLCKTDIFFC